MDAEALIHANSAHVSISRTVAAIEQADGIVIATPIFKASYSGLLKVFLDLLPQFALSGKAVLPIATGGSVNDIVLTVKVTVVGPPASIVVAASPTSVRCGEKSTITATVKDAIGQNVSEHTRVEAVTNSGGTLAGTGAVANQAGLVSPISSTPPPSDTAAPPRRRRLR